MRQVFTTPLTEILGVKHPVMLAGMNVAAGPELAAAVSNAGGIGTMGGVGWSVEFLKQQTDLLKSKLRDPALPWGIDLLLPKVGDGARATNKDYTRGKLMLLVEAIIESGARLFVSAVGVPPKAAVDKLHAAGIPVMNMVGHPKHVKYALEAGVDIICCQGTEAGGVRYSLSFASASIVYSYSRTSTQHTGSISSSVLVPACVDACRGRVSPFTKREVPVVAAGGVYDGRGLASALCYGASVRSCYCRCQAVKTKGRTR